MALKINALLVGGFKYIFYFHPYLGKISNLTTFLKINMEPKHHPIEKEHDLPNHHFSGSMLIFQGLIFFKWVGSTTNHALRKEGLIRTGARLRDLDVREMKAQRACWVGCRVTVSANNM